MELRQLVYFDAVARHRSFTRAAEQLHVAQPAISAQIRRLENELGTELLQRTTRRVSLTHGGDLFWSRVRGILGELDAARADLEALTSVLRGQVRIGATPVLGPLDLAATMAAFRNEYPGVALALRSGLIADLLVELDAGEIDIVIGPADPQLPRKYVSSRLVEEGLVLITPPGHRLAGQHSCRLGAAHDEWFVCLPSDSGLRRILTAAAQAEGFTPRIEFEAYSPASVRDLVAAGLGVALLARSAARSPGPRVAVVPLDPAPEHPPISVITLRQRKLPAAPATFRAYLRDTARQEKTG